MLYSTVEVHGDSPKAQVGPTMFMSLLAECVWGLHLHHSTDGDVGRLSSTNNIFNNAAEFVYYSDVAFPEKYVTENFQEIFRKISGNFQFNRKNVFIHNVSMKTAENTGKLLHSFKS